MSLNINDNGSPTPRKTQGRFTMADQLAVDTSPEVLGAVGSGYPTYPPAYYWPTSSLTSHAQGVKRPLNVSTRGNLLPTQEHTPPASDGTVAEGYKV